MLGSFGLRDSVGMGVGFVGATVGCVLTSFAGQPHCLMDMFVCWTSRIKALMKPMFVHVLHFKTLWWTSDCVCVCVSNTEDDAHQAEAFRVIDHRTNISLVIDESSVNMHTRSKDTTRGSRHRY